MQSPAVPFDPHTSQIAILQARILAFCKPDPCHPPPTVELPEATPCSPPGRRRPGRPPRPQPKPKSLFEVLKPTNHTNKRRRPEKASVPVTGPASPVSPVVTVVSPVELAPPLLPPSVEPTKQDRARAVARAYRARKKVRKRLT
jgi:hypothetical protein